MVLGICFLLGFLFFPQLAAAAPPIGFLDGVGADWRVWGWALDPDNPHKAIDVHLYLDGPAGSGQLIAVLQASRPREDVNRVTGFPEDHGFEWHLPSQYRRGFHQLYAYGIDYGGKEINPHLSTSPRPFGVRAYKYRSMLYLDNGPIRVGVNLAMGGAVSEILFQGLSLVNSFDVGREIQTAFYDGNQKYEDFAAAGAGQYGWNPVQGGDRHNHPSPVLNYYLGPDSIYIKTRSLEWKPDDKGGGPYQPVWGDLAVEQWLSFWPDDNQIVKLRYKITHLGTDSHGYHLQELPAIYLNPEFNRLVYESGRGTTVDRLPQPWEANRDIYTPEYWAGLVNASDTGLTVFAPGHMPYVNGVQFNDGPAGFPTQNFRPLVKFKLGPKEMVKKEVYLIPGNYERARQKIHQYLK